MEVKFDREKGIVTLPQPGLLKKIIVISCLADLNAKATQADKDPLGPETTFGNNETSVGNSNRKLKYVMRHLGSTWFNPEPQIILVDASKQLSAADNEVVPDAPLERKETMNSKLSWSMQ